MLSKKYIRYVLLVWTGFGGITCSEFFIPVHSWHLAILPFLRRFFCDLVNGVSFAVFPHIAQAATATEAAP